jgi:hypothetical protein
MRAVQLTALSHSWVLLVWRAWHGMTTVVHYPTHFWNPETGHVGWTVFHPDTGANSLLFRTPLAAFLRP